MGWAAAGVSGRWRAGLCPGGFLARAIMAGVCWLTVGWATQALPALAGPLEKPELSVGLVSGSSATLFGVLSTNVPGEPGAQYEFLYRPGSECQGPGQVTLPATAGVSAGGQDEQLAGQQLTGLAARTQYTACLSLTNAAKSETVISAPVRFITQATGAFALPDGRAWELVSPPNKHGSLLEPLTEGGGVIQASVDGSKFAYVAVAPVSEQPAGTRSPNVSQLLSTRTSTGWATQDISTPHEEIAVVLAGDPSEYKFLSEDLSAGIVEPLGTTPLSTLVSERTPYRAEPGAGECPGRPAIVPAGICYQPLVTAASVPLGIKFGGVEGEEDPGSFSEGVTFTTATPDLSDVVLSSPQPLTEDFAPGFSTNRESLYEMSPSGLRLVSFLPRNEKGEERPAAEAEHGAAVGREGHNMRGAISNDGNRVVFEVVNGGEKDLYVRDMALGQTVQLDVPQPGAPGGSSRAESEFQVASSDASKVFFKDQAQLTADPAAQTKGRDLYLCEVVVVAGRLSCTLSDLSVDVNPGEPAEVGGVGGEVSAVDASGRFVYFTASGVLTSEPNTRKEAAQPGNCESEGEAVCNMYVYDTVTRHIRLVAVLSSADKPDWSEGPRNHIGSLTAGSSPDGQYFVFMSDRPLTGYDNTDVNEQEVVAGEGKKHADEEVFLYDALTGGLSCVSCNPSGGRPHGVFDPPFSQTPTILVDNPRGWPEKWLAGSVPGWTLIGNSGQEAALHQPRYLFDSGRVFFDSADGLVGQDANGVEDVYEFEPTGVGGCSEQSVTFAGVSGGCVSLISSGVSSQESAFLDASENGDDVFFLTAARLSPFDVDSAFDVYDAHVCSSGPPCPTPSSSPPVCEGDACQGVVAPLIEPTPGTLTFSGAGDLMPLAAVKKVETAAQKRARLLVKALRACRREPKRKRVVCERRARRHYGVKAGKARHGRRVG